jgi:hypothetical protein
MLLAVREALQSWAAYAIVAIVAVPACWFWLKHRRRKRATLREVERLRRELNAREAIESRPEHSTFDA